jgi:hypothetical protein
MMLGKETLPGGARAGGHQLIPLFRPSSFPRLRHIQIVGWGVRMQYQTIQTLYQLIRSTVQLWARRADCMNDQVCTLLITDAKLSRDCRMLRGGESPAPQCVVQTNASTAVAIENSCRDVSHAEWIEDLGLSASRSMMTHERMVDSCVLSEIHQFASGVGGGVHTLAGETAHTTSMLPVQVPPELDCSPQESSGLAKWSRRTTLSSWQRQHGSRCTVQSKWNMSPVPEPNCTETLECWLEGLACMHPHIQIQVSLTVRTGERMYWPLLYQVPGATVERKETAQQMQMVQSARPFLYASSSSSASLIP